MAQIRFTVDLICCKRRQSSNVERLIQQRRPVTYAVDRRDDEDDLEQLQHVPEDAGDLPREHRSDLQSLAAFRAQSVSQWR